MNNEVSKIQEPVIQIINGRAMTSSLDVAKFFKKDHKNVLRRVDKIKQKDPNFYRLNFEPIEHLVPSALQGTRRYKAYLMSRAGFSLVVLGFTGDAVFGFQIAYVKRFEEMDAMLRGLDTNKKQLPLFPVSPLDMPLTIEQRNSIALWIAIWAGCAKMGPPRAWQKLHKHFGVKSIEDYRLSQLAEIIQWLQERVSIATATGGLKRFDLDLFDPRRLLADDTNRDREAA